MVGGGGGMGGGGLLENANPLIYERSGERPVTAGEEDEQVPDSIDAREIFDIRRCRAGAGGTAGPGGGMDGSAGLAGGRTVNLEAGGPGWRVVSGAMARIGALFLHSATSHSLHQRP